jgi:mannitol-1-phosphate/altronate dehydrogenase
LLGVEAIFGKDLPRHPVFVASVTKALGGLIEKGAKASLAAIKRA